jgi:hypothetical protein
MGSDIQDLRCVHRHASYSRDLQLVETCLHRISSPGDRVTALGTTAQGPQLTEGPRGQQVNLACPRGHRESAVGVLCPARDAPVPKPCGDSDSHTPHDDFDLHHFLSRRGVRAQECVV